MRLLALTGGQQMDERQTIDWTLLEEKRCVGALTSAEIEAEEEGTELRLHTCGMCGKRNLYPSKDPGGKWALESHGVPVPRL